MSQAAIGVFRVFKLSKGTTERIKKSRSSAVSRVRSGSKLTKALDLTRSPVSEISFQAKTSAPAISFAARNGSIADVRHDIGKPGKIRKPRTIFFLS